LYYFLTWILLNVLRERPGNWNNMVLVIEDEVYHLFNYGCLNLEYYLIIFHENELYNGFFIILKSLLLYTLFYINYRSLSINNKK